MPEKKVIYLIKMEERTDTSKKGDRIMENASIARFFGGGAT